MRVVSQVRSTPNKDQIVLGMQHDVANAAGSGAGSAVTTPVAFNDLLGNSELPTNYTVLITPSQACMASATNKTSSGFDVVLTPPSGVTLAAGTFDVVVIG